MRVAWVGTFDPTFPRNVKLDRLLALAGVEVRRVNYPIWGDDRVSLASRNPLFRLPSAVLAYSRLLTRLLIDPSPDVYLVSYPGWFDVVPVKLVAMLRRRPLVFDVFISAFDTVVADRGLRSRGSLVARFLRLMDIIAMRLADVVIADTAPHAAFFAELSRQPSGKFEVLWLGANDDVFVPRPEIKPVPGRVEFHGTFVPLQGIDTILRAALELQSSRVRATFRIVGDGQAKSEVEQLATELGLDNVEFVGSRPLNEMPMELAQGEIVLGIFGQSDKSQRVVPNKVYEGIAMGRPVITADSPAMRAAFGEGEVALVPHANPGALAERIRYLLEKPDVAEHLANAGRAAYLQRFHESALAVRLEAVLSEAR